MQYNLEPPPGRGGFVFRICGQIGHRVGPLHPGPNEQRRYGQLYIYDANVAVQQRILNNAGFDANINPRLLGIIEPVLRQHNPFAAAYRHMYEVELEQNRLAEANGEEPPNVRMYLLEGRRDPRRYNRPQHEEVAAVYVDDENGPPGREMIIHPRNAPLQYLSNTSPNLDPMSYPLTHPYGQPGWHHGILLQHPVGGRHEISMREFYAYKLAIRAGFNPVLESSRLTQQYVVDQWVKIEHQRLQYLRENQRQLRVDWYRGLHDHVQRRQNQQNQQNGGDAAAGVPIVLPSTHQDSPRNMQQRYQDAMAIVTKYGKPDYFITMTCNPQWPEIVRNLRPGQTALNAPHLVSRVFRQYLNAFISDLWENGVLGRGIARIHVIEFQKRGYPHAHILLTVRQEDKLRDAGTLTP